MNPRPHPIWELWKVPREEGGWCCSVCGYKYTGENAAAFDFHHVNPVEKDTNLRMANSLARLQKEVEKCILLCSNCHRVLHASQELVQ